MHPPPLKPEKDATPPPRKGRLNRVMELLAESDLGDYFTAGAAAIKAFREARRLRSSREMPREPEERDI